MSVPKDTTIDFSMKSFETKVFNTLKPSKNSETEKIKRKTLATDASGACSPDGSVTYTFKADTGTLTVSGVGDKMQDYLPSQTGGAPWYSYKESVKNVVIEDGVTSIANYAFANCGNLLSITIPDSVTSIRNGAFSGCGKLASITIPDYVTSIGDKAFSGCYNLKAIDIPGKVMSIGNNAFEFCSGLVGINIPESVTSIGDGIFMSCNNLKSITVDTNNNYYKGIDGILFSEDGLTLMTYPVAKTDTSYEIPAGVESIGNFAFNNCYNLEEIIIPESVTSIGNSAFRGCFRLNSINIPDGVISIGSDAFNYCSALTEVNIPEEVTSIGDGSFRYCSGLTSITIPKSVASIGSYAFAACSKLASVTILGNNTTIGDSAFASCSALKSINLGEDSNYKYENGVLLSKDGTSLIKYIGENAKTYNIPDSVTSIGDNAFSGCNKLTEIIVPKSVTLIGSYAFAGCSELVSINIPNGVTEIGRNAFAGCSGLTSINIPDKITSIETSVFYRCSGLTSITIPDNVISIANSAFGECSGLVSVTIGKGVESLKNFVFDACTALSSITIPESVTSIEDNAFHSCSSLTSFEVSENNSNYASFDGLLYSKDFTSIVQTPLAISGDITLHHNLTSIGSFAFSSRRSLVSVTIPDSVTLIERYAFHDCTNLASVTYLGKIEPQFVENTFNACNILNEVNVPYDYEGDTFCGKPVNKILKPASDSEEIESSISAETSSNFEDIGDSESSLKPTKNDSKTAIIAGTVSAAAFVAAVVIAAVMYVKKLACFAQAAVSTSEGGASMEDV